MFAKSFTAALVVASLSAFAQNTASEMQLAGVKANFQQAQLVPQFLPTFNPSALLNVSFGSDNVEPGTPLAATAVSSAPTLTVIPASNFSSAYPEATTMFTVAMVDADIVGTDESGNQTRHWLANNVALTTGENGAFGLNYTTDPITNYAGPGPAEGSGAHRYVLLFIDQPSTFTAPADLSEPNTPLGTFNFQNYLSSTGLGPIVAANYITVENGVATVTVASTSAVQSSTLVAAAATSSGASSAMSSGASSMGSASHSGSSSATKAASSAASAASSAVASASATAAKSGANTLLPAGLAGLVGVGALAVGLVF
ncbi:hypothetical protein QFC22_003984 [Naganishia vaughanmartiniae]|uniref:Uncharacterized protein n=1 Tax=Naganishia vaughanmartiniae TaxID=1424756 RepID=A0ACC2X415_9TREE|nr:hypothetical protein QFC22_003984 [Naganishia vaughanmartiniae]